MKKDEKTYAIIGAAMEVHSVLGPGRLEAVYHEAFEIEFNQRGISYCSKPQIDIYYKEHKLQKYYMPDFIAFDDIVVELKAESSLTRADEAQIINSLKCCNKKVGLLINFGEASLQWKRFVN
jgi:GxxExxY protein